MRMGRLGPSPAVRAFLECLHGSLEGRTIIGLASEPPLQTACICNSRCGLRVRLWLILVRMLLVVTVRLIVSCYSMRELRHADGVKPGSWSSRLRQSLLCTLH